MQDLLQLLVPRLYKAHPKLHAELWNQRVYLLGDAVLEIFPVNHSFPFISRMSSIISGANTVLKCVCSGEYEALMITDCVFSDLQCVHNLTQPLRYDTGFCVSVMFLSGKDADRCQL